MDCKRREAPELSLQHQMVNPEKTMKIISPEVSALFLNGRFATSRRFMENDTSLAILLQITVLCHNPPMKTPEDNGAVFDPVAQALVEFAARKGFYKKLFEALLPRRAEFSCGPNLEISCVIHEMNGKFRMMIKGHPEALFSHCTTILLNGRMVPITYKFLHRMAFYARRMSLQKLAVIAMAYKDLEWLPNHQDADDIMKNLTFAGFVGVTCGRENG